MTSATTTVELGAAATPATRWTQLILCILCMVLIANLQYGWTLFVNPINKAHGWSLASIQFAFSIFIALETWLTPIEGWIVDTLGARTGPKLVVACGGILVALGWVINSYAQSLEMLYLGAVVGGTGGGAIYATCVGPSRQMVPGSARSCRGPDSGGIRRRFCALRHSNSGGDQLRGLRGGVLLVRTCPGRRQSSSWRGCCVGRIRVRWPGSVRQRSCKAREATRRSQVLSTPVFWLLYIMFIMVSASAA